MNKLEMVGRLPNGDIAEKVKTAAELSILINQIGQDMAALVEETRRSMASGQAAAARIDQASRSLEGVADYLRTWKPPEPPPPLIHEAPVWPMLLAALMIGMALGLCGWLLVEYRISPLLHAQSQCPQPQIQQVQPAPPPRTAPRAR